ncbi:MAG: hypothetical protein HUU14_03315 [Dehalococcoidia bacterium]|nr:hypothetical protein [Dehalococcoidia bacterium]
MYVFAVLLLIGLVIAKIVDLGKDWDFPGWFRLGAALVLGLVAAYAFDFDMFAAWGLSLRGSMGTFATGLVFGATASAWHEILDLVAGIERKTTDEALQMEMKSGPKAA